MTTQKKMKRKQRFQGSHNTQRRYDTKWRLFDGFEPMCQLYQLNTFGKFSDDDIFILRHLWDNIVSNVNTNWFGGIFKISELLWAIRINALDFRRCTTQPMNKHCFWRCPYLGNIPHFATGAMKTTATATIEMLIAIPPIRPIQSFIQAKAFATADRMRPEAAALKRKLEFMLPVNVPSFRRWES